MSFASVTTRIPLRDAVKMGFEREISDILEDSWFTLSMDPDTGMLLPDNAAGYYFIITVCPSEEDCYFKIEGPKGRTDECELPIEEAVQRIVGMNYDDILNSSYDIERVWAYNCRFPFMFSGTRVVYNSYDMDTAR